MDISFVDGMYYRLTMINIEGVAEIVKSQIIKSCYTGE